MTAILLISVLSLAALFFLTAVLFLERKTGKGGGYLIALCAILELIITLRLCYELTSVLLVWLPFVVFPAMFLFGPAVYLYSQAVLFSGVKNSSRKAAIVAVPVAVCLLHVIMHVRFPELHTPGRVVQQAGVVEIYTKLLFSVAALYNLVFVVLARRSIAVYMGRYEESFSESDFAELRWLKFFVLINMILVSGFCAAFTVSSYYDLKIPSTPFEGGLALIMIYAILYYRIRAPQIFSLQEPAEELKKYEKQNLSTEKRREYIARIEEYIGNEKPFLDDRVTLADLARDVGIPEHHFSMAINLERQMNFFHFINAYRVAEARTILMDAEDGDATVLEVAYRAGFQSKASFNRIFKKLTGNTPSEFRKIHGRSTSSAQSTS